MSIETKNVSSAIEEAQNILNAAESKAEKILYKAEQEFETAKDRGFQAGLEQGKQQATETAIRLIEESSAISEKLAEQAAKLAIAIAEDIVGKAVEINPSLAKEVALKALNESVVGSNVRIIVNQEDLKTIEDNQGEIKKLATGSGFSIEVDENISRGGCIIRTDFGEVDSRISTLVEMIKKKLGLNEQ